MPTQPKGIAQLFHEERYQDLARRQREAYAAAEPFPHAVLDDFLPAEVCAKVLTEFPNREQIDWMRFERHHSKKLATSGDRQFGDFTRELLREFNGAGF